MIEGANELLTRIPADGEFTFNLTEVDAEGNELEGGVTMTTTNVGSGFTFADVAEFTQPGVIYFKITEAAGSNATIGYSTESYIVTVTVTGTDVLTVDIDLDTSDVVFTNTYTPNPVTVTVDPGTKALTGRALKEGEFEFQLVDSDGNVVMTTTNAADGTFTFEGLTYHKTGTYVYTASEVNNGVKGVVYDGTVYTITVVISENAETHALESNVTYTVAGEDVSGLNFKNAYTALPTSVNLGAFKVLDGAELTAGQFSFRLINEAGEVVETVTNDANGSIDFSQLTFDAAGVYTYTIVEVDDGQDSVTYDATVHTAVVTVTDDLEGNLTATVTYDDGSEAEPTFTNAYESEEPDGPSPSVGDDNNILLLLAILIIGLGSYAMTYTLKRRKK